MSNLLPCPFCAADNAELHRDNGIGAYVACIYCGLEAPSETGTTEEWAVKYWNTRALQSPPAQGVANSGSMAREALELAAEFEGEAKGYSAMGDRLETAKCLQAAYALRKLAAAPPAPHAALREALEIARAFIDPDANPPRISNREMVEKIDATLQPEAPAPKLTGLHEDLILMGFHQGADNPPDWKQDQAETSRLPRSHFGQRGDDKAVAILRRCVEQYPVASGTYTDTDGVDGYGPLREARIFLQNLSCGAESNRHSGAVGAEKRAEQSNPGGDHEVASATPHEKAQNEAGRDDPTPGQSSCVRSPGATEGKTEADRG